MLMYSTIDSQSYISLSLYFLNNNNPSPQLPFFSPPFVSRSVSPFPELPYASIGAGAAAVVVLVGLVFGGEKALSAARIDSTFETFWAKVWDLSVLLYGVSSRACADGM